MRTRRSPRNQDRLFSILFKPSPEPVPAPISALVSAQKALALGYLSPRTRKHYERIVALEPQKIAAQEACKS